MKARVLIAAADDVAWSKHRVVLARDFQVTILTSANAALQAISGNEPFAVVIADLRLSGLSGIELLATVRSSDPNTGRILVIAGDDREAAFDAVNRAGIHGLFIEPFASEVLLNTVRHRADLHTNARHAAAVQAQVADGVAQLLTGALFPALAVPPPDATSGQIRERARALAQAMKLPTVADLDLAALLSRAALASVPEHVLLKLRTHERLAPAEVELLARIPDVGRQLVPAHPRFAGVAEVFRHQGVDPGPMTVREDGVREHKVMLAARILRAVVDLQLHELAGLTTAAGLAELRRQAARYDADVLKKLEELLMPDRRPDGPTEECMVEDLVAGCVLATDALSLDGVPLVSAGTTITPTVLSHLRNFAELGEIIEPIMLVGGSRSSAVAAAAAAGAEDDSLSVSEEAD